MPFKTTPELPPPERQPFIAPRDLSVVMRHRRLQLFFVDGNVYEYLKTLSTWQEGQKKKIEEQQSLWAAFILPHFLKALLSRSEGRDGVLCGKMSPSQKGT